MLELRYAVMRCALAVVFVAACGSAMPSAQLPPIPSDAPPGTRWITPILPWHLTDGAGGVVVTGNIALVAGGTRGEIEEIDLTTGMRGRVYSLGKALNVQSFARISDGRYLLAGSLDESVQVALLDPETLAPTWFTLDRLPFEKDVYAPAVAIELPDHSIVIAGIDLPLALYDAQTMTRTRVLQEHATWTDVAVSTTAIYARNNVTGSIKIDLASAAATAKPLMTYTMAAAGDTTIERTYEKGQVRFRVVTSAGPRDLPTSLGYTASLDATGTRIASLRNGGVTVYSTADGAVLSYFDLAPQTMYGAKLVFAGDTLVIASGSTIRVANLTTKALTSVPEPYGPYMQLAVDNGGTVTAIGAEVWRYRDAKLVSTASLGKQTALVTGHPLARFATRTSRPYEPGVKSTTFPSVITVKTLEGRPIRDLTVPRETDNAWIGDEGKLVISYKWQVDQPQKLVRALGTKLYDIVAFHLDATVDDVDVDGGIAAFSLGGTTTLLDTTTGEKTREVYNPSCAEYGLVELERHGDRVLATDDRDAILYDRTTGRAVGAARFPDAIQSTTFILDERSVLVRLADQLLLWDPSTNTTRTFPHRSISDVRLSPDRRHAVFELRDSRLALVDFSRFRAAMLPGPTLAKIEVPTSCSERDPFDLRDPTEDEDEELHEDSDEDSDEDLEEDTGD